MKGICKLKSHWLYGKADIQTCMTNNKDQVSYTSKATDWVL